MLTMLTSIPGGVKVAIDVGFDRDEVNTAIQNVDLANGQQHVCIVKRTNRGRNMEVLVSSCFCFLKEQDVKASVLPTAVPGSCISLGA